MCLCAGCYSVLLLLLLLGGALQYGFIFSRSCSNQVRVFYKKGPSPYWINVDMHAMQTRGVNDW